MQIKNIVHVALLAGLSGCATLPSSGPTGSQIRSSAKEAAAGSPISLVEVRSAADVPPPPKVALPLSTLAQTQATPTDMVGPGDILDISIYEAGVTLFASSSAASMSPAGSDLGVQVQKLPPTRIDDQGDITIPYVGTMHVAGQTTGAIESAIRKALLRLSQNPQVLVTLNEAITNAIIVGGEVSKPGRLVLHTNRESLSDVIALAGGYRGDSKDLMVRIMRGQSTADVRINDLIENPDLDVAIRPGDRLMLVDDPRTYSILGASGRVQQIAFSRSSVSLAEAVANAGAFAIVLEGVPLDLAAEVTKMLPIPTIGIGAGPHCDGQILVMHDLLGLSGDFEPKFVKRYANLEQTISNAVSAYISDVRDEAFPQDEHSFH